MSPRRCPPALLAPALLSAVLVTACQRTPSAPTPQAPLPTVRTSTSSAFVQVREGARPVFSQGKLHVYINPAPMDLDLGLPGIAFGGANGPRFGLLGGYFAPRVLTPDASKAYTVHVHAGPQGLDVRFDDDRGATVIDARVLAHQDKPQVVLRSGAWVSMPADRVEVFGALKERPAFSRQLAAGADASIDRRHADRVQVVSEKKGAFVLASSCAEAALVQPVLRGSTSVFVLHTGPGLAAPDVLFAPLEPKTKDVASTCPASTTSTLSLPSVP